MKFGDEFLFSINGTMVERVESKTLRGNYYGMLVYGKGTYVMEKYKSFQIDEQIDIDICTAMITHFSSI